MLALIDSTIQVNTMEDLRRAQCRGQRREKILYINYIKNRRHKASCLFKEYTMTNTKNIDQFDDDPQDSAELEKEL